MKLTGNYKSWEVTQDTLGKILNVTQARISQLAAENVVKRSGNSLVKLAESIQGFIEYKGGVPDYKKEKALNEKAKRQMNQLKLMMRQQCYYQLPKKVMMKL